jgi:hypothetical protein
MAHSFDDFLLPVVQKHNTFTIYLNLIVLEIAVPLINNYESPILFQYYYVVIF